MLDPNDTVATAVAAQARMDEANRLHAEAKARRLATTPGRLPLGWGRAVEAAYPTLWPAFRCEVPAGWVDLVLAFSEHAKAVAPTLTVEDAKEKFGGLRLNLSSDAMTWDDLDLGEVYESMSMHVCQDCGEPGKLRTDRGWDATLCDVHAENRDMR